VVNTIKFSQFQNANPNDPSVTGVGLGSGNNVIYPKQFSWAVATRPATPYNGLLGYNTDLDQYEYWDSVVSQWVQLLTTVSPRILPTWSSVTAPSIAGATFNGYVTNNSSGTVNILLPAIADLGDPIFVRGLSGGWILTANIGQVIVFGNQQSSAGGSIASTLPNDNVTIECLVPNSKWTVASSIGNITII
jgi:hypothetical protein